jgi:hypothetical protein
MTTDTKVTVNNDALAALLGVKKGETVPVKCKNGVPTSREWRNRFKDAGIDDCITISQNGAKSTKKTKGSK